MASNNKTSADRQLKIGTCSPCCCSFCQVVAAGGEKQLDPLTGRRLHICNFDNNCAKLFYDVHNLKRHLRSHTGERPFACEWPKCDKKFSEAYNLKAHMMSHTGEKIQGDNSKKGKSIECFCSFCQFFNSIGVEVVDSTGTRVHNCQYENCSKSFNSSSDLAIHLRTHTVMKRHARVHSREKIYECDTSGHKCSKKSDLTKYIANSHKVSAKKKSYDCDVCFHRSSEESEYVRHLENNHKSSGKSKSYKKCLCPNCQIEEVSGKTIVDSCGKRLHNCHYEKCDKIFHFPYDLLVHLRSHNLELLCACGCLGYHKKFIQNNNLLTFSDQNQLENSKKPYSGVVGTKEEMQEVKIEPNQES